MQKVIYRKNKLFIIDKDKIKPHGQKNEVYNALYAAIYTEFQGANFNANYKDLTNLDKLDQVNAFAYNWLKQRGFV